MYHFFNDPAHAWLKVSIAELQSLGIANKISCCSYIHGEFAYLEEDCDAQLFVDLKRKLDPNFKLKFKEHICDNPSRIRSFQPYVRVAY